MVKLRGPGLAVGAAGSIADTLTFSSKHGKPYLKIKRPPAQPRTPSQVAMRQAMSFLAGAWAALGSPAKSTWETPAAQTSITPFNAYVAHNLTRWNNWLFPTQSYPATEDAQAGSSGPWNIDPLPSAISVDINITNIGNRWGMAHFLTPGTPITPTKDLLIRTFRITDTNPHTFIIRDIKPGQYSIMRGAFTTTGTFPVAWQSHTTEVAS